MMDNRRLSITCHHVFDNACEANNLLGASNKTYCCITGRNMTMFAGPKEALLPCVTVKYSLGICFLL